MQLRDTNVQCKVANRWGTSLVPRLLHGRWVPGCRVGRKDTCL